YALVNAEGSLVEFPICYRDERTSGVMEDVFAQVSRTEIFERTGIQFLPINTLFQMCAHTREEIGAAARTLLLIPDFINFYLTGRRVCEHTNATTTQMLNAHTHEWDCQLLKRLSLPTDLLPPIVNAGSEVGWLRADLATELDIEAVRVVAPATHDTGSAVAGTPIEPGWAYISSGTWSLVGVERSEPLINPDVARQNFT